MLCALLLSIAVYQPCSAQYDVTAPGVTDLIFTPPVVDSAQEDQLITVTLRITDDLSGVESAHVLLAPDLLPTGQQRLVSITASDRIAGNELDGVYRTTLVLPRYSAGGRWSIQRIEASDRIGNYADYYPPAICGSYGPSGKCIDPSNMASFVNGEFHLLYLPVLAQRE
jgi:hypothetical protein